MKKKKVISELMMVDVDLGLEIPDTFPLKIQEKLLVVMGEFDIGPRPTTIPPREEIVGVMMKDL